MGNRSSSLVSVVDFILHDWQDQGVEDLPPYDELVAIIQNYLNRPLTENETKDLPKYMREGMQGLHLENQIRTYMSQNKINNPNDVSRKAFSDYIKSYGYDVSSQSIDKAIHYLSGKKCGPRPSKNRPAYLKAELVKMVVDNKLEKNGKLITEKEAKAMVVSDLCELLQISEIRKPVAVSQIVAPQIAVVPIAAKECGPIKSKAHPNVYTKDEILSLMLQKASQLGMTPAQVKKLTKAEMCAKLGLGLEVIMKEEYNGNCSEYTMAQLRYLLKKNGLSTIGTKKSLCMRLDDYFAARVGQVEEKKIELSCMNPINPNLKLQNHQKRVVEHLLKNRGLIAIHSTGSGKTLTAVSAINCILNHYPDVKVVFIAPLSLLANMKKELVKFGLNLDDPSIEKRIRFYSKEEYGYKQYSGEQCRNTFLIVDEAHNLRGEIKSKGKKKSGKIADAVIKCAQHAFKVLLLTATPMVNRASDMINLITMVDGIPHSEAPTKKQFYDHILKNEDAFNKYFACKISMNLIPKTGGDYPKRIDVPVVKFKMTKEYYDRYYAIQEALNKKYVISLYGDPSKFKLFYSALRRASLSLDKENSPKIQWIFNKLKEEVQAGRKSIVFTSWKESGISYVKKLLDEAHIPYGLVTGDETPKEREIFKNAFNAGKIQILLLTKAGREGLDLVGTRNVFLLESSWNKADEEQIIGRAIRYKSHAELPAGERDVKVWRLMMVKPVILKPNDKEGRSVDEILYDIAYVEKEPEIEMVIKRLEPLSIENLDCDKYNGGASLRDAQRKQKVNPGADKDDLESLHDADVRSVSRGKMETLKDVEEAVCRSEERSKERSRSNRRSSGSSGSDRPIRRRKELKRKKINMCVRKRVKIIGSSSSSD